MQIGEHTGADWYIAGAWEDPVGDEVDEIVQHSQVGAHLIYLAICIFCLYFVFLLILK